MKLRRLLFFAALFFAAACLWNHGWAAERNEGSAFTGQDLRLSGHELISYQLTTGEYSLVFSGDFSLSAGGNRYSSDAAVVWLESITREYRGQTKVEYEAVVYLGGNISREIGKSARAAGISRRVIEDGEREVLRFIVSGSVFATAEKRTVKDPREMPIYKRALAVREPAGPRFVVQPEAVVPEPEPKKKPEKKVAAEKKAPAEKVKEAKEKKPRKAEEEEVREADKPAEKKEPARPEVTFGYPVNFAPVGDEPLKLESMPAQDGMNVAVIGQRFYVWQKQDEEGGLLELQADKAVVYYPRDSSKEQGQEKEGTEELLSRSQVKAIYLSGDVIMTEAPRTIRAEQLYYDFELNKGIAVKAVMRSFDAKRGIPIYIRAEKLKQVAQNQFTGSDIVMTTSEFHQPQVSLEASKIIVTDSTVVEQEAKEPSDRTYDAQMYDVRMKMGKATVFYWPYLRSDLERPDIPIKSAHAGYDSDYGAALETRWYLARLLGLREPEGVDSTLALDFYSKRGMGGGAEIDYSRDNYFGRLLGYVIHDRGDDKLGRLWYRKDVDPPRNLRGRFYWKHRHFLPYNWQLTSEVAYTSDEYFMEAFYRNEYNVGKQETYVHLKRIEDNWGLSFLAKPRINDFADVLEELPTAEFHLTGESFWDDRLTFYSRTQASRYRQRIGNKHGTLINENRFGFLSHRSEVDFPLAAGPLKLVPYMAGTLGYDDRSGFQRTLVNGAYRGPFGDKEIWVGEAGIRAFPRPYWKIYPGVKSKMWDLNQLRHIVRPQVTGVLYEESDDVVKQRDTLNLGIYQRLQTKRGEGDKQREVDWMELDMDFVWVKDSDSVHRGTGPDRFIWNDPIVPMRVLAAPDIFHGDLRANLRRFEMYGPKRNYFSADYIWRLTDTTAVLADAYFDTQSGVVQQLDFGFSRLVWPDLSYYIGSRYRRRLQVLGQQGTNVFTFAATYKLDPRYTLVFSHQVDFDYDKTIRSDLSLIRRYHRLYYAFTYSADHSLDRQAIMFTIWPQGVPELSIGGSRFVDVGRPHSY